MSISRAFTTGLCCGGASFSSLIKMETVVEDLGRKRTKRGTCTYEWRKSVSHSFSFLRVEN